MSGEREEIEEIVNLRGIVADWEGADDSFAERKQLQLTLADARRIVAWLDRNGGDDV